MFFFAGCADSTGTPGLAPDSATVVLHYIERPVGTEEFAIEVTDSGYALRSHTAFVERGSSGDLVASLELDEGARPTDFTARGRTYRFVEVDVHAAAQGSRVEVQDLGQNTVVDVAGPYFLARGWAPLSARAALIASWEASGRPHGMRLIPGGSQDSILVEFRGVDTVWVGGRPVVLQRYSVDGVVWGKEAVWLDQAGRFAAALTRIHILPLEGVRKDLLEALPQLQAVAIRDRMGDLADMSAAARPMVAGDFALVGVRVVDGSGAAQVDDATVVVRGDRIVDVGPRDRVTVPEGVAPLDAGGLTVVPGLWDMHGHVGQIEWAQAYLAVGVTTVRDMGGERRFLTAFRDAVDQGRALGPRMVLAGLVDGSDSLSFGMVTASTPEEGRAVVDSYHDEGFRQMKLYSRLRPEVVAAITSRAHQLGMTVTGHIPSALTLQEAIVAGMDQVAHMPFRGDERQVRADLAVLAEAGTVVDPTLVWSELLGRSRETPIADFEPGIRRVAGPMAANYRGAASDATPSEAAERLRTNLARVAAMRDAGVRIVAGTDGAVPGFSLLRELELYVAAGLTPMQALQAATVVPARALGMAEEVGTVEVGKRADLLVLEGNPLTDISKLRRGRWVVVGGRVFDMDGFRR